MPPYWKRPGYESKVKTYPTKPQVLSRACNDAHRSGQLIRKRHPDHLPVIGTSGAISLPLQIGKRVMQHNGAVIDVNHDENPFAEMARTVEYGPHVSEKSGKILPQIITCLVTI
jgi:hypothetical protein